MTGESDYPRELVDIIVVDNASEDGAAEMVREEFPDVQLIVREENCGVSGWNDGLAVASGDWVLLLDDDCYLPPDGLRRAVLGAREHEADLVSFAVLELRGARTPVRPQVPDGPAHVLGLRRARPARGARADRRLRPEHLRLGERGRVHAALLRRRLPASAHAGDRGRPHEGVSSGRLGRERRRLEVPDEPQEHRLHGRQAPARARGARARSSAILATHLRDGLRGRPRAAAAIFTVVRRVRPRRAAPPAGQQGDLARLQASLPELREPVVGVPARRTSSSWRCRERSSGG